MRNRVGCAKENLCLFGLHAASPEGLAHLIFTRSNAREKRAGDDEIEKMFYH
jgi:hypothetical protein